jgi:predicted ABC-type transport system involved in lysophospholipase L1 biosynthesis ATPase subunit
MSATLVSIKDVVKGYAALRPLRVQSLSVSSGDVISLTGLDAPAAEVFVGLVTGALLPDSGEVTLFDHATGSVSDSDAWLRMLDGVGILTDRAVLIGQFSVEQNIAMPFTLDIDPVPAEERPRVAALAEEVGLTRQVLNTPIAKAPPEVIARVRLARAIALAPSLLLAEHPSASLPRVAVEAFAEDIARVARTRALAVITLTADREFAAALGGTVLTLDAATGALRAPSVWTKLFKR